jgi:hypothetical protein
MSKLKAKVPKYLLRFVSPEAKPEKTTLIPPKVENVKKIPLTNIEKGLLFEKETIRTLTKFNFNIKSTKQSHDHGIDFWGDFHSIKILGQCKNESKPLGEKYLRDLEGNLTHHGLKDKCIGILVSVNGFTDHAIRYLRQSPSPLLCIRVQNDDITFFLLNKTTHGLLPMEIGYSIENGRKRITFHSL